MVNRENCLDGITRLHRLSNSKVYKAGSNVPGIYGPKSEKEKGITTEGKIRLEIGNTITKYIFEDKSLVDLITLLNTEEKYKPYREYFKGWIDDKLKKKQELIDLISKKLGEGLNQNQIEDTLCNIRKYQNYQQYIKKLISEASGNIEKVR